MSTPQFLAWLDAKMAPHSGKVVPPVAVMAERLEAEVRAKLRESIARRVLAEAGLDGLVERAVSERLSLIRAATDALASDVADELTEKPTDPWTAPVGRFAESIAGGGRQPS